MVNKVRVGNGIRGRWQWGRADEVAADASWLGMCQVSVVPRLIAAVRARSTWDLAALAAGSAPGSAWLKMPVIFLGNNKGYFMGMLLCFFMAVTRNL